ncbi:hypothetical protein QAD02_012322 [Eretmocerus hayati]|uniref:Uncharacterized protein n=1 Tax=Eretmocerus hayati TaxID=131215 RepID=A0ACC2NZC1_9HYME|nr:hypothetical protein QAD02_012322 [Eretmocerus hayati]
MNWKRVVSKTSRPSSQPVGIASFKQLSVSQKLGHKIMYKKSLQKDFECLVTRKGPEDANMKKFQLKKAYFDVQGLPKDTRKDLVDLCEKNIIKYPYHEYYKSFKVREVDDAQLQSGNKPAQSQAEKNTSQPRSARIVARVHSAKKIPLPRPAQGTAQPRSAKNPKTRPVKKATQIRPAQKTSVSRSDQKDNQPRSVRRTRQPQPVKKTTQP